MDLDKVYDEIELSKTFLEEMAKDPKFKGAKFPEPNSDDLDAERQSSSLKISTMTALRVWRARNDREILEKKKDGDALSNDEKLRIEYLKIREKWRESKDSQEKAMIRLAATSLKKQAIAVEPKAEQMVFSFVGEHTARTSPFFPMSRRSMSEKNRVYEVREFFTQWGCIKLKGERLSIYDESVLLAVLHLVHKQKSTTVKTTPYQLCQLMGVKPAGGNYNAIWASAKRMTGTYIEVSVNGKQNLFGTILTGGSTGPNKGDGIISVNPYFLHTLADGFFSIDVKFRAQIKGDVSKALYRFLLSQKDDPYICKLYKVARAVNIETETTYALRRTIRKALKELKDRKFLKNYKVDQHDTVWVWYQKRHGILMKEPLLK